MKNILVLIVGTLLFAGVLFAATNPLPTTVLAPPVIAGGGALSISSCTDGEPCNRALLSSADGGLAPHCPLGQMCNNDQLQQWAGHGGPFCPLGQTCNNDQLQQLAGDGGPPPYCAPGRPCNNDQLQQLIMI